MEAAVVRLVRFALIAVLCAAGVALANTTVTSPITFGSGITVGPDGVVSVSTSSAGITLISTQTASNSTQLAFTGLGSTYSSYQLRCYGIQPVNNATEFELQVGTGAGPTYQTTLYDFRNYFTDASGVALVADGGTGGTNIQLTNSNGVVSNSSSHALQATVDFANVASTTFQKNFGYHLEYWSTSPGQGYVNGTGTWGANTAITAIRVLFSSGNISAGSCSLYGYAT